TGIDIRDGAQLECIQCGLCIDACDTVMTKVGRPTRLIAYDSDLNIARRAEGRAPVYRFVRARTIIYAAIIAAVALIMLYTLATRHMLDISVLHDRNPLFVSLSDGSIRNAYTVRVLNKSSDIRTLTLDVDGLPGATVHIVGGDTVTVGKPRIAVGPDQTFETRVLVTVGPDAKLDKSTAIVFRAHDDMSSETAAGHDHFITP